MKTDPVVTVTAPTGLEVANGVLRNQMGKLLRRRTTIDIEAMKVPSKDVNFIPRNNRRRFS